MEVAGLETTTTFKKRITRLLIFQSNHMKNNSFIRCIGKLFALVLLGFLFYYLSIQLLLYYTVPKVGHRISWGIGVYYSYFVFFAVLCAISFSKLFRNKIYHLVISILSFIGFLIYWKPVFKTYPNRTLFALFVGLSVCFVTFLISRKLKYEKK